MTTLLLLLSGLIIAIVALGWLTVAFIEANRPKTPTYISREKEIYFPMFDPEGMILVKDIRIKRDERQD